MAIFLGQIYLTGESRSKNQSRIVLDFLRWCEDVEMSQRKNFMNAADVRTFIARKTVRAMDPATGTFVAKIAYSSNGSCDAHFETGETDSGKYGFEGQCYWTRYEKFRAGRKHLFSLEKIDDSTVQAYHEDGSKAFLMSHETPSRESH